jgi:hypothetical protein
MATLTDTAFPNILNVTRRTDPDGPIAAIAELLSKREDDIVNDIPWVEGNLSTGHRITTRTGLPSPTWRKLNQGLDPVKSETAQFDETCGILEAWSRVDVDVAKLNGNAEAYRASEDTAFLMSLRQQLGTAVFYESATTNPERIHGLAPRYGGTTGYVASGYTLRPYSQSGGTADNHSIWLINWAPRKVYGIYPRGLNGGLVYNNLGMLPTRDANSKEFLAYVSQFQWKCGLAVEDYRYTVRLQWDPSDSTNYADSGKNIYLGMQQMMVTCYDMGQGQARFYMNRTSFGKLTAQLASNSANFLQWVTTESGRLIPSFLGVPIRVTDLLVAESYIA